MCDILYSVAETDFGKDSGKDNVTFTRNHSRGCGHFFTFRASYNFLERNNLVSIIRSSQPEDTGFRMHRNIKTKGLPSVITIFSAPNYRWEFKNKAAILKYIDNAINVCQFSESAIPFS